VVYSGSPFPLPAAGKRQAATTLRWRGRGSDSSTTQAPSGQRFSEAPKVDRACAPAVPRRVDHVARGTTRATQTGVISRKSPPFTGSAARPRESARTVHRCRTTDGAAATRPAGHPAADAGGVHGRRSPPGTLESGMRAALVGSRVDRTDRVQPREQRANRHARHDDHCHPRPSAQRRPWPGGDSGHRPREAGRGPGVGSGGRSDADLAVHLGAIRRRRKRRRCGEPAQRA
jgi:hypothetical protein